MTRLVAAILPVAVLGLVACGGGGSAAGPTPASTSSAGGGGPRGGAAGELVQRSGANLVLSTQAGDVTVTITATTPVRRTSTGTVADIVSGSCIVATGQRDAAGALSITAVVVSEKVGGACPAPGRDRARGLQGGSSGSPAPSGTPRGPAANVGAVGGEVTAVDGTSVTLRTQASGAMTITVPTTVRVSRASAASTADLAVGQCVLAAGSRSAAGTVTARQLTIVPAGPSGCFSGGGAGRGPGGGFGGGFAGPPGAGPAGQAGGD